MNNGLLLFKGQWLNGQIHIVPLSPVIPCLLEVGGQESRSEWDALCPGDLPRVYKETDWFETKEFWDKVDRVQNPHCEKEHSSYPPFLFVPCFQVIEAIHQAGHTLLKGVQSVMLRVVTSKAVPQTTQSISY